MPSWASSRAANPARTRAWSSASRTRITAAPAAAVARTATARAPPRPPSAAGARRPVRRPARWRARSCRGSRGPRVAPPSEGPGRPVPSSSTTITRSPSCSARSGRARGTRARAAPRWSAPPARSGTRPRRCRGAGAAGVTRTSTLRPVASARRTSSATSRRPGAGARGISSPGRRSESSTDWTSTSASRLASLIAVSAVLTCSGRWSISSSATPACTLISDRLCATTSCSSRAMPSRSSLARRRSASSAERCSSIARCLLAWAKARRLRISSAPGQQQQQPGREPYRGPGRGTG